MFLIPSKHRECTDIAKATSPIICSETMKSLDSSSEVPESLLQPDPMSASPPWKDKCLWGKMNSNSSRIKLSGNAVSWVNSLSCLFYWLNHWVLVFHWDPCQFHLLVSRLMLRWNLSALQKVRHRNSCCLVTFRASCVPVSGEGRLLKEVNTQCLHCQDSFCPKARAAFRQKGPISEAAVRESSCRTCDL